MSHDEAADHGRCPSLPTILSSWSSLFFRCSQYLSPERGKSVQKRWSIYLFIALYNVYVHDLHYITLIDTV